MTKPNGSPSWRYVVGVLGAVLFALLSVWGSRVEASLRAADISQAHVEQLRETIASNQRRLDRLESRAFSAAVP